MARFRPGSPLSRSHHDVLGDLEEEWRARRRDGGPARAAVWYGAEVVRVTGWVALEAARRRGVLRGLREDAREAARGLRRNPVFSVFAVLTLAVGVGAATAWLPAADATLLHPAGKLDPERVVDLWAVTSGGEWTSPTPEQVDRWAEMDHLFEVVHRFGADDVPLMVDGAPVRGTAVAAGPGFFEFVGGTTPLGRYFTPGEARSARPDVVVLSWEFWQNRLGGAKDVLGRTLEVEGRKRVVVGVVERGLGPPGWRPGMVDVWFPPEPDPHSVQALARLAPGVDVETANATLSEVAVGTARETGIASASGSVGAVVGSVVRVGGVAVGLLFLIAFATLATLMVQRRLRRSREIAFRVALGVGMGRLTRVALLEGVVLGVAAALLGVLGAVAGVDLLERMRPEWAVGFMGLQVGPWAGGIGAALGVAAGVVAVAVGGRPGGGNPARLVDGRSAGGREGTRLRWVFLTGQIAVSYVLMVAAVVLAGRFHELKGRDPGYDPVGLGAVVVDLPEWGFEEEDVRGRTFRAMRKAVGALEGVDRAVLAVGMPPGMEVLVDRPRPEGAPPPADNALLWGGRVEPGFLATIRAPLVAGRGLRSDDGAGAPVAVIGETLARRLWEDVEPEAVVGRRVVLDRIGTLTVVGVVRDIRVAGLAEETPRLLLFRPVDRWGTRLSVVFRSDADPQVLFPRIASAVTTVEARALVGVYAGTEALAETIAINRFLGGLFGVAAGLALFLSVLGLYGVLSQAVIERYRELGIRASLGAGALRLRWRVLSSAASVAATGLALGALAGGAVLPWVPEAFVQDVPTARYALAAAVVLVAVALPAVWLPAARATRVDPAEALRAE